MHAFLSPSRIIPAFVVRVPIDDLRITSLPAYGRPSRVNAIRHPDAYGFSYLISDSYFINLYYFQDFYEKLTVNNNNKKTCLVYRFFRTLKLIFL